jgi:hypothetical protein
MHSGTRKNIVFSWTGRVLVAVSCGLALASASAARADPETPVPSYSATNPYLDGWVEDRLQDMMIQCIGGKLTMLKKKFTGHDTVNVSAIPPLIRGGLNLGSKPKVVIQNGSSLTKEFGYIRPDPSDASFDESDANALSLNYANFADQLPTIGVDQTNYVATCSSILAAKATTNGDFSFPMATVKAGLDADYDTSSSYSISMVAGHFESPIVAMYQGLSQDGKTVADSASAALLFWNWYARNQSKINSKNYILRYFNGVSIYTVTGLKKKTTINVNLSSQFSLPMASASATNTLGMNQTTDGKASGYKAAVILRPDGKPDREYFALPSLDELRKTVSDKADVLFDAAGSDDLVLLSGTKKISETAYSVPGALCKNSEWTTDDARVSVTSATPGLVSERSACKFTLTYIATSEDMKNGAPLKLSLSSKTVLGVPVKPIKVPLPPITYVGTKRPLLEYIGGGLMPAVTPLPGLPASATLTWKGSYKLSTDPVAKVTSADNIDTTNLELTCPKTAPLSSAPSFAVAFDAPQGGNVRNLWITVTATYVGPTPDPSKLDGFETCQLGGSIDYTVSNLATPITRSAPTVKLAYPKGPAN